MRAPQLAARTRCRESRTLSIVFASTVASIRGPKCTFHSSRQFTALPSGKMISPSMRSGASTLDLRDADKRAKGRRNLPEPARARRDRSAATDRRGRSDAATAGCRRPRAPHHSVPPLREVHRSWIASLDPQRLPLHAVRAADERCRTPSGGMQKGDPALAGGWRQRDTDRDQVPILHLAAASNDHRPSPIRPVSHQRQVGQWRAEGQQPTPKRPAPHARDRAVSRDGSTSVHPHA